MDASPAEDYNGRKRGFFYRFITQYDRVCRHCTLCRQVSMMKDPQHHDMQIQHIAEICGFKSSRAFSILLKKTYGKSPMEWRTELWDADV